MLVNILRRGSKYEIESYKIEDGDRHISGREFTQQEVEFFKSKEPKQKPKPVKKTLSSKSK